MTIDEVLALNWKEYSSDKEFLLERISEQRDYLKTYGRCATRPDWKDVKESAKQRREYFEIIYKRNY
jgi:hypothetical protein